MEYSKQLATNYNTFHKRNYFGVQLTKIITYLGLDTIHNLKVVDFGCGSGRLLKPLKEFLPTFSFVGIDLNQTMLDNISGVEFEGICDSFENFYKYENIINADVAYFSYSLHQLNDKQKEIKLLKDIFEKTSISKILLITQLPNQFKENWLNKNSEQLNNIDLNRYLNLDDLKEFNLELIDTEQYNNEIRKEELIKLIENKYISTLHSISDVEYNSLLSKLKETSLEYILYPDFYSYILIKK